jgi:hypothetical protein
MNNLNKIVIALFGASLIAYGACHILKPSQGEMVNNRLWVDHFPEYEADLYNGFVFFESGVGVQLEASVYRNYTDIFTWDGNESRRLEFPQDSEMNVEYTLVATEDCNPPEPFELCMTLSTENGEKTYYSRWDFEIEEVSSLSLENINFLMDKK